MNPQLNNSLDAEHPTFVEGWVVGTYIVAGVFSAEGRNLTVECLVAQIPSFYAATRSHKRAIWPRGICGYFLIPIYIAESFDKDVIEWVHSYHPYRWAIWHVPVLYTSTNNNVDKRVYGVSRSDRYGYGSLFWPYLESIIGTGLRAISHRFGYEFPEIVNGKAVQKGAASPVTKPF